MSLLSWLSLQLLYSHLGMNTGGSRSGLSCLGRTAVGRRSRAGRAAAADGLSGEGKRCLRAGLGSSFQPGGVLRLAWNEPKLGREEVWGEQVEAEVEDLRSGGDNLSRREGGHLSDLLCRREGGHPFSLLSLFPRFRHACSRNLWDLELWIHYLHGASFGKARALQSSGVWRVARPWPLVEAHTALES